MEISFKYISLFHKYCDLTSSILLHLAGWINTERLCYTVEICKWQSLRFPVKTLDTLVIITQSYTWGNRCVYLDDVFNVAMYSMVTRSHMSIDHSFLNYWMRYTENLMNVMAIQFYFLKEESNNSGIRERRVAYIWVTEEMSHNPILELR